MSFFTSDIEPGADGTSTVDLFSNRFMKMVQLLQTTLELKYIPSTYRKDHFRKTELHVGTRVFIEKNSKG